MFLLKLVVTARVVIAASGSQRHACSPGVPPGDSEVTCEQLHANGFTFDCRFGGTQNSSTTKGNVVLLHGFPEWSIMYQPFMKNLAESGYKSVACNQRGYSPQARPGNVTSYNYHALASDVFAIAEASGFERFHLVGHDHGAALGWYVSGGPLGREKIISYSALSIPHLDAFSAGLFGATADVQQQCASQYFTMFVQKNSAESLFCAMGLSSGFHSCSDFQKALWWYNGAMDAGVMSMPPLMSASELYQHGRNSMALLRLMWGGNPNKGFASTVPTGTINVPVLYVCGKSDTSILCNRPYALKTKDYCKAGYSYLEVDCGHSVMGCGRGVEDAVLKHIEEAASVAHDDNAIARPHNNAVTTLSFVI